MYTEKRGVENKKIYNTVKRQRRKEQKLLKISKRERQKHKDGEKRNVERKGAHTEENIHIERDTLRIIDKNHKVY
jgi:hypothetical protein